ncbi:MAG: T9SS type A sorting domain-containing protein [Bacteroidetes bacterium]|nr:T9SS type A sorting domain-containing protein [Bacteroidota bacterium]
MSGSECHETRLRLWDVQSGNMLWDYQLDSTMMCTAGVKFSSNGSYLAALEELGHLLLFDVTGTSPILANTIYTGTAGAFSVDFSPASDKVATGCTSNKLIIYDVATGGTLHNIIAHTGYVFSVAWSHNGQYIATAGQDNKVKLWDTSGNLLQTYTGHTGDVFDVKFTPNDDFLVSGSQDNSIKIWNRVTGMVVQSIAGHTADVRSIAISPNGNYILSGATDGTTRIWDFNTYAQLANFNQTGAGNVYTVAWSPTENKIVTGTQFNMVLLWDISQTVGISDFEYAASVFAYPNPVQDFVVLKDVAQKGYSNYEIFSATGEIVQSGSFPIDNKIEIDKLPSAHYSVRVFMKDKSTVFNFIKQ